MLVKLIKMRIVSGSPFFRFISILERLHEYFFPFVFFLPCDLYSSAAKPSHLPGTVDKTELHSFDTAVSPIMSSLLVCCVLSGTLTNIYGIWKTTFTHPLEISVFLVWYSLVRLTRKEDYGFSVLHDADRRWFHIIDIDCCWGKLEAPHSRKSLVQTHHEQIDFSPPYTVTSTKTVYGLICAHCMSCLGTRELPMNYEW